MGSNDVLGYNCAEVEALREPINASCASASTEIPEILKKGVVTPMSTVWYAPEAVDFFTKFAEVVASTGETITEAFDNFRAGIQDAGKAWAEKTGGETPTLAAIDQVTLTLDTSAILAKDASGNVTINTSEANSVAGKLDNVEKEIEDKLKDLAKALDSDTAFIGGNQAKDIEDCFQTVSASVSKIFKFLTEGDDSLANQIKKASDLYGQQSDAISSAFSSAK